MTAHHAVVWIDHKEAKVFKFSPENLATADIKSHAHHAHVHAKHGTGKHEEDPLFLKGVTDSLGGIEEILVVGPGSAKLQLIKYVHKHQPAMDPKVVGVETVDHPTDNQIVAYARTYFTRVDKLR